LGSLPSLKWQSGLPDRISSVGLGADFVAAAGICRLLERVACAKCKKSLKFRVGKLLEKHGKMKNYSSAEKGGLKRRYI
jgi:hypothetical protein